MKFSSCLSTWLIQDLFPWLCTTGIIEYRLAFLFESLSGTHDVCRAYPAPGYVWMTQSKAGTGVKPFLYVELKMFKVWPIQIIL